MPAPCGKCDPSIRLRAKLESCHSSSPSDCICLKPKWNFKWIPQRILSPALPSLLLNRITVSSLGCPFPSGQAEGPACLPGGIVHNIPWESGIALEELCPSHDFCGSTQLCVSREKREVSSSCLRAAGSRTGPARPAGPSAGRVLSPPFPSSCPDSGAEPCQL